MRNCLTLDKFHFSINQTVDEKIVHVYKFIKLKNNFCSGGADDTCNVCTTAVVANGPRAPATLGQRNLFRNRACECFQICLKFKKAINIEIEILSLHLQFPNCT